MDEIGKLKTLKKMWKWKATLMVFLCLLLVGCGSALRPADVVGTYQAQVGYGAGLLVLHPNGEYSQTFTYKSGRVVKHSGKWTFNPPSSVFLDNALAIGANLGSPDFGLRKDNWSLTVESRGGHQWMEFNPDEGWFFHKVK